MAANNTGFLNTTELDFNSVKTNLKTYLQNQSQFADYNFEGSNFNVLLDVLAYNTYLNSFYLNMVGSEMFLDTAQLKESVVSHAKELNYLPRSRTSAVAYVDITVDPGTNSPSYITIPKNYAVKTSIDSLSLNYLTTSDLIVIPTSAGVYKAANVAVYEGRVVTEYFNVANGSTFVLQSANVDTRSIDVYVYESNVSNTAYTYTQAVSLYGLSSTSNVYFIQGKDDNKYEITFGNGVSGRSLPIGSVVKVEYRDTLGDVGNGAYAFSKTTTIDGYSNVTIATVAVASEGSEREDISSIKFNAPRYFAAQERCVTAADYINLTKAKFPQLQSVNAYGGEELDPPQYGKVAVSVKPYGTTAIISNFLKNSIVSYLSEKNLTIEPIIVDPEFYYVRVDSTVTYDTNATTLGASQIKTLVENAILNYGQTNLAEFGDDLRYTKLVSTIDDSDSSIVSNETKLYLSKRWSPSSLVESTQSFSYENPLYHEDVLYELPQGHEQAFFSSTFSYQHSDGNIYSSYIGDNGLGALNIYTNQIINGVTQRTILNENIGTVNYYTGAVSFSATVYSYSGSYISLYGMPKNKDLFSSKNKFLLIDSRDLTVITTVV